MITEEEAIDTLAEFLAEVESYLYDWTCTYTGEYKPVDHQMWIKMYTDRFVREKGNYFIDDYKDDIKNNKFPIPLYCFALAEGYKQKLYLKHKENVEMFEKKYNIK